MIEAARRRVLAAPDQAECWYELFHALHVQGETSSSRMALLKAMRLGFRPREDAEFEILMAAFTALGEERPRWAEILKPCPLVGELRRELDPRTERIIATIFDAHNEAFASGRAPLPRLLPAKAPSLQVPALKILLLFVEYSGGDERNLPNEILEIFDDSARRRGFIVKRSEHAKDILHPPGTSRRPIEQFCAGLERFHREIEQFKPDLVIHDGNFFGDSDTIEPYHFADRDVRGYKLVTVIGDLYDERSSNLFDYWGEYSDLVVYLNKRTTHAEATRLAAKGLYWPCLPFDPQQFAPRGESERTIDLCLQGHGYRQRDLFALLLRAAGFKGYFKVHDRSAVQAMPRADYLDLLGRSRLVFNNGHVSANLSIVTGRPFEAMLSGAVLLNETGDDLDSLYVPYVHYVPFANIHQLGAFAKFLLGHDDTRRAIAARAMEWTKEHFVSKYFWDTLIERLGFAFPSGQAGR